MKRILVLLFTLHAACFTLSVTAQRITHDFRNVSMAEALKYLQAQTDRYTIVFIYNDLEDFRVSLDVHDRTVPEAIRQLIGFYPVRMVVSSLDEIYVEVMHRDMPHLTGRLIDERGQSVPFADVTLLSPADSSFVAAGISNEGGYFVVPTMATEGLLRISCLGFRTLWLTMTTTADLGNVAMHSEAFTINGVEVTGRFVERNDNGDLVVRVHGNPLAEGQVMDNFLNTIPGVILLEDKLQIAGSPGVIIEMDKQQITLDELRNLPLDLIQRIEVVRSPDIKYGATMACILRIVLRNELGLLGSLRYQHEQDEYGTLEANPVGTLLLRQGHHSLYNYASVSHYDNRKHQARVDEWPAKTERCEIQSRFLRPAKVDDRLSYRYEVSPQTEVQAYGSVTLYKSKDRNDTHGVSSYLGTLDEQLYRGYSVGASFSHSFGQQDEGPGHELNVQVTHSGRHILTDDTYDSGIVSLAHVRELQNRFGINASLKLHLDRQQTLSLSLSGGTDHNDYRHEGICDATLSQLREQSFYEDVLSYSASAEYDIQLGNVGLSAWLHYSHYPTKRTDRLHPEASFTRPSGGLNPWLRMTWHIDKNKGRMLQLSYMQGHSTPNYNYFTPTVEYISPRLYSTGNPHLKDERHYVFDAEYAHNYHTQITFGAYYHNRETAVLLHQSAEDPDEWFTRPENIGRSWRVYSTLSKSGYLIPRVWFVNTSLSAEYNFKDAGTLRLETFDGMLSSYHQWRVTPTLSLSLMFAARTKPHMLGGEGEPYVFANPGASLTLLGGRLSLNAQVNYLLYHNTRTTWFGEGFRYTQTYLTNPIIANLTVTWNFHVGRKIKDAQLKQTYSEGSGLSTPKL